MTRLLAIADWLFGPDTRHLVFEPLVADRDREIAANRSIALRLRWWFAIASAIVTCAPRATFGRLPSSLVLDLGKRAVAFGTLAYAMQWLGLVMTTTDRVRGAFPPSLATTVPFLVIPVIWRIWVASIPRHQKRLLAAACATICMALCAVDAGSWVIWVGYAAGVAWLTACGWRLGDPNLPEKYQTFDHGWYRTALVASGLVVAWWPVKLAMQIGLFTPFWPRHYLLMSYIFASVITLNIENVPREQSRRAE